MAGIYIHIPFCKQACSYCDFYFITQMKYRDDFVSRLLEEIRSYRDTLYTDEPIHTIYLGGGTPSVLPVEQIGQILDAIEDTFDVRPKEITMEMNPDNVTADYLNALREAGIHRASMGVQSFNPDLLEFMHRAHDREEALRCLQLLDETGFPTYSVDLIYGNPGQSTDQLASDLEELVQFDPPHVSAYSLTIEPNTRLGKQHELGRLDPLPDERVAEHFELVVDRLEAEGLKQYEVSNYSKPGQEAHHNAGYWTHVPYIGVGPSAHSFWWADDRPVRWYNKPDIMAYLSGGNTAPVRYAEELTHRQLAEERIMMGLRTREGVGIKELEERYDYRLNDRQLAYLQQKRDEGRVRSVDPVRLTSEGLKIADAIILDLVSMKN